MIDLRKHHQPVLDFVRDGLAGFRLEHPSSTAGHVALYCCPWSGWVSLCVNEKPMPQPNCPDFDFVEYRLYDASEWATEYEAAESVEIIGLDGEHMSADGATTGDEAFNQVFFQFLRRVLVEAQRMAILDTTALDPVRFSVQLLDSAFEATWNAGGTP